MENINQSKKLAPKIFIKTDGLLTNQSIKTVLNI